MFPAFSLLFIAALICSDPDLMRLTALLFNIFPAIRAPDFAVLNATETGLDSYFFGKNIKITILISIPWFLSLSSVLFCIDEVI